MARLNITDVQKTQAQKEMKVIVNSRDTASIPPTQETAAAVHQEAKIQTASPALQQVINSLGLAEKDLVKLKAVLQGQSQTTNSVELEKVLKELKLDSLTGSSGSIEVDEIAQVLKDSVSQMPQAVEKQLAKILTALNSAEQAGSKEAMQEILESAQAILKDLASAGGEGTKEALSKLLETFKELGVKTRDSSTSLKDSLEKFIDTQLADSSKLEISINSLLQHSRSGSGLDTLLNSLSDLLNKDFQPSTELGKEFIKFVENFLKDLGKANLGNNPHSELKGILEQAVKELEAKFTTKEAAGDFEGMIKPHADLERPLAVQLKSISSQIKTVLSEIDATKSPAAIESKLNTLLELLPDDLLKTLAEDPALRELSRAAGSFKDMAVSYLKGGAGLTEIKESLIKLLETISSTDSITKSAKEIRDVLNQNLSDLSMDKLSDALETVLKDYISSQSSAAADAARTAAPAYNNEIIKPVFSRELLQSLLAQGEINPDLKPMIELLLQTNEMPISAGDREALVQMAELLTQNGKKLNDQELRELKGSLKDLITKLTETVSSSSSSNLSKEVLTQFEQLLKGQEALARLNPLMSAAGDPIMILFPAIIGGLLANFETTFFPPVNNEEENKNSKSQNDEQQAALSVNLPGLGEVGVLMSIKGNKANLEFSVESQEVTSFMRKSLKSFSKRLAEDFDDHSVKITSRKKTVSAVPAWLKDLVRHTGIVA